MNLVALLTTTPALVPVGIGIVHRIDAHDVLDNPKTCNKCGQTKEVEDFYLRPDRKTRLGFCIECYCAQKAEYRARKKELKNASG